VVVIPVAGEEVVRLTAVFQPLTEVTFTAALARLPLLAVTIVGIEVNVKLG
jgi:hypothetical protein